MIPSGGHLVPEIKVGKGATAVIVSDSEKILHWADENYPEAQFYPNELASELSVRASDNRLAGFVWYYNWVEPKGFSRSTLRALRKSILPAWLNPFVPDLLLAIPLQSEKAKFRRQACQAIGVEDGDLDDENRMRSILVEELEYFQSHFKDDEQPYIVPGTMKPTAADFSIYAQLERLVGGEGAYDVYLDPAIPELKKVDSLARLAMARAYP